MTRLNVWLVGCVAAAAVAVLSSCTSAPNCTPANCNGCCTSAGRCAGGMTAAACGSNGSMCQACADTEGCYNGICTTGNGGGTDGNGGGDGSNGGGTSSNGGGASSNGGGSSGGGHTGGGSGGGGHSGGGTGGGSGGQGGGMVTCSNLNCSDGCCVQATCVHAAQQNNNQCGMGGLGCQMCAAGNTCVGGTCMGSVTCGTGNCTGCCSNNSCVPIAQQGVGACGTGGNACGMCNGAQTCVTGVCQTPATLGGPCSSSANCSQLGAGAICKLNTSTNNAPYPMGFCTLPCQSGQQEGDPCASGNGTCISGPNSPLNYWGESDFICAPNCPNGGTQSNCRNGYVCYGDTTGGFCWLNPIPPFDGGGPATKVGTACTTDSACQNPPDPLWGFCVPARDSSNQDTGWTGGYCTAECTWDNTGKFCGTNAGCFDFSPDDGGIFYACLEHCSNPGGGRFAGRTGYSCFTGTGADGGTIGYVYPSCDQPGNGCSGGYTCNTTNGYCCMGSTCLN